MSGSKWNHRTNIVSALRRVWRFSPEVKAARDSARVVLQETPRRVAYRCARCGGLYKSDDVQVDHIVPVVPVGGFDSWDGYVARMFCGVDGYQVLCGPCHDERTAEQRTARVVARRAAKSRQSGM